MTPPMYQRLRDLFVSEGLITGSKIQWRQWRDSGNKADQFVVFRSAGGTDVQHDQGGDWFVMVDVISALSNPDGAESTVNAIVDYVLAQEGADDCVGALRLTGGIPSPIMTEEGRLVWRLLISCTYGE